MTGFSPFYRIYIHSPAWKARRERAIRRAGNRCQVCGERKRLQVHHVSYANLGHELDEDLTVMCFGCHFAVTWWLRLRRFWRWLWSDD